MTCVVQTVDPENEDVVDVSNDNDPSDGNLTDDPTEFDITATPQLTVIKKLVEIGTSAEEDAVFSIEVKNTGTVTLTGVGVTDTMTNYDGDVLLPVVVDYVEADGTPESPEGTLKIGETAFYTVTYELTLEDIDSGGVQNTATATATTPLGGTLQDVSDDDGENPSDPTTADITPLPSFEVTKKTSLPRVLFPTVEEVTFTITVKNTGNLTQTNIQVLDDLTAYVSPARLLDVDYPASVTVGGFENGAANGGFNGITDIQTLAAGASLAPNETGTITVVSTYSTATGRPNNLNVASVTSDQLETPTTADVLVNNGDLDGDGVADSLESDTQDRDGDGIPDRNDYDPTGYFYCEENGRILSGGLISVSGNGFTQTGVGASGPIVIVEDGSSGYFQFFATAAGTYTLKQAIRLSSTTTSRFATVPKTPTCWRLKLQIVVRLCLVKQ